MRATGALALLVIAGLLVPSLAEGSRPPTRGEEKFIRSAFREAHYNTGDGVKLKSVREVRVSTVDQRWASVIYKKGKGGRKRAATATDYFFFKGSKWKPRKKRRVPGAVVRDLKQPPRPYTVTIRYAGSGTFTSNREESEPGYSRQVTAAFNWDLTWEDVELYDDHYPEYFDQPSAAAGGGTWSVTAEDPPCSATGTFQLAPIMSEFYIDRGVEIFFKYPEFVSVGGCGYLEEIWGDAVASNLAEAYYPNVKDIPMFPEQPIEIAIRSRPDEVGPECSDGDLSYPGECALGWSGTVTITPPP